MTPYLAAIAAVFGAIIGAAVIYLSPRLVAFRLTQSIALPPAIVLIPFIGAVVAGWRPVRSLILQGLLAAIFLGLAARYGADSRLVLACAYCCLLVTIGYIDLDHRLVLNRLSYPGIALSLAASFLWPGLGPISACLGALAGLLIFGALELLGRGALGTGDTKLAILIGAMRGLPGVFDALLLGVLLGGVAGLFYLVVLRRGRKEFMAYGPYLAAGAVISFLLANP